MQQSLDECYFNVNFVFIDYVDFFVVLTVYYIYVRYNYWIAESMGILYYEKHILNIF